MEAYMRNDRLASLLHYIIGRVKPADLGAVKLNKIAWFADRDAYMRLGRTISGREYIKLERGPVPKGVMADLEGLKLSGKIAERRVKVVDFSRREFEALVEPDLTVFQTDELEIVDAIIDFVREKTASEISEISHDEVWEACDLGEEISMRKAAAAALLQPIDERALTWAKQIDRV
jgi:Protein of unknown function (DUF4065)